jgi:hypothetical protein
MANRQVIAAKSGGDEGFAEWQALSPSPRPGASGTISSRRTAPTCAPPASWASAPVAAMIASFERGEPLPNLFDPARGY